jgi:hypothetical protein
MSTFIDFSEHYENLAQSWAEKLDKPFATHGREYAMCLDLIEALWRVYPEIIEYIEADPVAFAARVSDYRMALHDKSVEL